MQLYEHTLNCAHNGEGARDPKPSAWQADSKEPLLNSALQRVKIPDHPSYLLQIRINVRIEGVKVPARSGWAHAGAQSAKKTHLGLQCETPARSKPASHQIQKTSLGKT